MSTGVKHNGNRRSMECIQFQMKTHYFLFFSIHNILFLLINAVLLLFDNLFLFLSVICIFIIKREVIYFFIYFSYSQINSTELMFLAMSCTFDIKLCKMELKTRMVMSITLGWVNEKFSSFFITLMLLPEFRNE